MVIHEQPDYHIMHLHGSGEANRFPCQPFDPCTEQEMVAFDPLGLPFAREVLRRFQLPRIRAPVVSVKTLNPKRLQELLQLPHYYALAPAKHLREDRAAVVIESMPQPPRGVLLAHVQPHFVDLRRFDSLNSHLPIVDGELREPGVVHRLKLALIFSCDTHRG